LYAAMPPVMPNKIRLPLKTMSAFLRSFLNHRIKGKD
jgi:hypothetical protein